MGTSARFAVLAILAVLGTLSVTRLPRFAIYANERDAARLVRSLAIQLESEAETSLGTLRVTQGSMASAPKDCWLDLDPDLQPAPSAGPPRRAEAGRVSPDQKQSSWTHLPDLEWLPDWGLLRRHGYLFRARRGPQGLWVEAWPWNHGQTGLAAFRQGTQRPLEVHPNSKGDWSGVGRQPADPTAFEAAGTPGGSWRAFNR